MLARQLLFPLTALLLAAVLPACSEPAEEPEAPQDTSAAPVRGSAGEGALIAFELCARCHAVAPGNSSPVPDAPTFLDIAHRWPVENLAESMAEGMMVGHESDPMPVFQFTPEELDNLLAYLQQIKDANRE